MLYPSDWVSHLAAVAAVVVAASVEYGIDVSINQSINQSFILTHYVKEQKKLDQNTNVYK